MVPGVPLGLLPEGGMTLPDAIAQWQIDIGQYLDLKDRNNALIEWVSDNC